MKFFRAKVTDNKDPSKFGRVKVRIPDLMDISRPGDTIWATPGNNLFCMGTDTNDNSGSMLIPPVGSDVSVYFEDDNITPDCCYYIGGHNYKRVDHTVPYENTVGEYHKRYTLLKTPGGSGIILSDDSSEAGVSIKGKRYDKDNSGKIVHDTDTAFIIDDTNQKIRIQSGTSKTQGFIEMQKSDGTIKLQCNPNNWIEISPSGVKVKGIRIDLN